MRKKTIDQYDQVGYKKASERHLVCSDATIQSIKHLVEIQVGHLSACYCIELLKP